MAEWCGICPVSLPPQAEAALSPAQSSALRLLGASSATLTPQEVIIRFGEEFDLVLCLVWFGFWWGWGFLVLFGFFFHCRAFEAIWAALQPTTLMALQLRTGGVVTWGQVENICGIKPARIMSENYVR